MKKWKANPENITIKKDILRKNVSQSPTKIENEMEGLK